MNKIDLLEEKEKKAYDNLIMLKYFTMEKEDKESIDIILKLVETLIAENKELKEKNKEIEELEETLKCTQNSWFEDTQKIEELKAISEYRENIIKGLGLKTIPKTITEFKQLIENNDKKWEDKIKAKIEEINKEMLNEENSLELFYRKKYCKEVLQSLLGKE